MTWQPGQLAVTASDHAKWQAWCKAPKLEQQRQRRGKHPRIDYYPCEEVLALIRERTHGRVGGDHSSVIDALVLAAFRNKVERNTKGGRRDCFRNYASSTRGRG